MTARIREATGNDFRGALALLADASLPVADFTHDHLAFVAEEGSALAGVIGLEALGRYGLLRSLVVAEGGRSQGLGKRLVTALEELARERGIEEMWLLTIDADTYFLHLGYEVKDRGNAPGAIRDTAEFSGLCPDSAILMCKLMAASSP